MAIGVFDSGIGGLSIHRALVERAPKADFVYLADQAHAPYGPREGEEIVELTKAGCVALFEQGADLVVLACIIVPTIEAATGMPWEHEPERRGEKVEKLDVIGVFCTRATANSRVYEIEIDKRRQDVAAFSEPCPHLAGLIEQGAERQELRAVVQEHVAALQRRVGRAPDRAILGCTHYEIVANLFTEALPAGTPLIHQPSAVADALERYLQRHPEYEAGGSGLRRFLTTGAPGQQHVMAETFWGAPLRFEAVVDAAA
jgi:glutamate racemase